MKNTLPVLAIAAFSTLTLTAQSLVGSWLMPQGPRSQTHVVATFLPNGVYLMAEDGPRDPSEPSGQSGMERGTYRWNASTKNFSSKTLVDTTGEWGLSHGHIKSLTVSGNTLTSRTDSDLKLKRIFSSSNKLAGTWYMKEADGYAAITFLTDGTYSMVQDGKASGGGWTGMERGTYRWNPSTKQFTRKVLRDTNGTWGLSDNLKRSIRIAGNKLILTVAGEGSFTLSRVGSR